MTSSDARTRKPLRVALLHNAVGADASIADEDVRVQADAVARVLVETGCEVRRWECTLNLADLAARLGAWPPDVVFNLVESLGGTDRLMALPALLFESRGQAFTGSGSAAILASGDKLSAKRRLAAAGLPTPRWQTLDSGHSLAGASRIILKPVWEHGSAGMDDDAVVVATDAAAIGDLLRRQEARLGTPCFAEEFMDGREFNLSVFAAGGGDRTAAPQVLPAAEILFVDFPPGKPRIVGYPAKWDPTSTEYRQTPRTFDFPKSDAALLDELERLSHACWETFGLAGYARVDFRVDPAGRPWILEVNVNPCLSPDAGFSAALERAGVPFAEAVRRIVDDGLVRAAPACNAPRIV